jgi:DNA primase
VFITNIEELVDTLKPRLRDYLTMMIGEEAQKKNFCCYVHKENSPSMAYNPKSGFTTVHCFGCGATHDIFDACAELEGLAARGSDWVTQTLPHLAQKLNVEIRLGESSPADRAKNKLYRLCADIAKILGTTSTHTDYLAERGWSDVNLTIGQIGTEDLKSQLLELGWTSGELDTSLMLENTKSKYFGTDKVTFAIQDYRNRPVGFISRNLVDEKPKYINTPETLIYEKRKSLLGIGTALKSARREGLYIVEGPGDLAALHKAGVENTVAICGTAFTADHLQLLKMLGYIQNPQRRTEVRSWS